MGANRHFWVPPPCVYSQYEGIRHVRERAAKWPYWKGKESGAGPKEKVGDVVRGLRVCRQACQGSRGTQIFFSTQNMLNICQFSKKNVPTITKGLPLYKLMEVTLTALATKHEEDEPILSAALLAGATVATKYISNALFGDYVLLGAGELVHRGFDAGEEDDPRPPICGGGGDDGLFEPLGLASCSAHRFFKGEQWDPSGSVRGSQLLLDIVKRYARSDQDISPANVDTGAGPKSTMALKATRALPKVTVTADGKDEVDLYCGNISPVASDFDDPLKWWKLPPPKFSGQIGRRKFLAPDHSHNQQTCNAV
ncbi:hypothetical protein B0H14DRAFT_3579819 [Mycena olivaceomarginata]|nr:hypothetical protein B0H14DRAFT_3579819 [Mycena olivaceomarginata]